MRNKNIWLIFALFIYIVLSGIDRFVYKIPNVIYIPILILGIVLLFIGIFTKEKKEVTMCIGRTR